MWRIHRHRRLIDTESRFDMADLKAQIPSPDEFAPPELDEQAIILQRDWTEAEERKAKRK